MRMRYTDKDMRRLKVISLCLLACLMTVGVGCKGKNKEPQAWAPNSDVVTDGDCSKAKYAFACYLDMAMAKNDPNTCAETTEKRMDCLLAYEEIKGMPVDCGSLQDQGFKSECVKIRDNSVTRSLKSQDAATGVQDMVQAPGLKVDSRKDQ